MDTRKKACPNEGCKTHKKKKYPSKINYCPECGTELVYVCKSHNCYKELDDSLQDHDYCFECETERNDRKDKVIEAAKKVGGGVAAFAGVALIEPAKKALQKEGGALAKDAVKKGVDLAKNIVKK